MKLPPSVAATSRRAAVAQLMGTAALVLSPMRTPAESTEMPTFSLKGAPVFGNPLEWRSNLASFIHNTSNICT